MKKREPWENWDLAMKTGGLIVALSPLGWAILMLLGACQ